MDDADEAPLDPAASAELIAQQRARVAAATDVDGRLLFGAWGLAWLLGFGTMWLAFADGAPVDVAEDIAGLVFAGLLVAAAVVTTVHLARQDSGVRGTSATQGAMYGWAWFLSFVVVGALGFALGRADAAADVVITVMTATSAVVVGALYMVGAALWGDRTQFALGAWICVVTAVAVVVGAPHLLLVMALAGGGGMLIAAGAEAVRRHGRSPDADLGLRAVP